jgi:predicted phage terminase large subunit-like protein
MANLAALGRAFEKSSPENSQAIAPQIKPPENLLAFTTQTKANYRTSWHHELICKYCDRLVFGEISRLLISVHPRAGKTELVSRRLPAYLLGLNPDAQIIATSYSSDLASRNNRDVQRIIDSQAYRDIFPATTLSGKNVRADAHGSYLRNSEIFEVVNHSGSYRCAGVGGGITGMGFGGDPIIHPTLGRSIVGGIGIIDDPIKNRAEADSPTYRQKAKDWYTSTFLTREEGGFEDKDGNTTEAPIVVMATRWHDDDLSGWLKSLAESDPNADQWHVLEIPAIAEGDLHPDDPRQEGEAMWSAKYPLPKLLKRKASMGDYDWQALYQQRPTSKAGGEIKRSWWQYYDELPVKELWDFELLIQSWDCAFKGLDTSDYVVGQVWGKVGANFYLLDQLREKLPFTQTLTAIRSLSTRYPQAVGKLVEDKANGTAVIDTLRRDIPGLIPVEPHGGKLVRARAIAPLIESGNVYLPRNAYWLNDFLSEVSAFPSGSHDDQVDAMTQALKYLGGGGYRPSTAQQARWG